MPPHTMLKGTSFHAQRRIVAAPEVVFRALTTPRGIAGWWTHLVTGAFTERGVIRLEFDGMDEHIDLRQDALQPNRLVEWTCLEHSSLPEWRETTMRFMLEPSDANATDLNFEHDGLSPELKCYNDCRRGWDHFLHSLSDFAERGSGSPFRR
ncbi:MAG TPA: SRPBCC domain-containing protein [Gemmatimonadaceae bacterium]|nr:SRPBCC domain-containing protein [Gemmatimonadaceae bacterium]